MKRRSGDELVYDVARRIAELRESQGLTQAQFSARMGISDVYLRKIEAGGVNLTIRSMARFAATLKVDVTELFEPPRSRERRGPGRPPRATR